MWKLLFQWFDCDFLWKYLNIWKIRLRQKKVYYYYSIYQIKFDVEATLKPEKEVYFLKHLLALLKVREISVFNGNRVTEAACALNTPVTLSVIHVETNLV